ncbi:MAG: hypothetical protein EU547_06710 [Promethearchaeota archaeon]|nr:MAG: hypothetical protein EU547_06710 [Candidatus Lokiarchaeota archaeon]
MNEISGIYILTEGGNVLFNHEIYVQGSDSLDSSLFSNFVLSIQQFSNTMGEKEANRIELGKSKVFLNKDTKSSLIFVIKSSQSADNKKMNNYLKQIRTKFLKQFSDDLKKYPADNLKMYIYNLFITEIEKIIKDKLDSNFADFFDTL